MSSRSGGELVWKTVAKLCRTNKTLVRRESRHLYPKSVPSSSRTLTFSSSKSTQEPTHLVDLTHDPITRTHKSLAMRQRVRARIEDVDKRMSDVRQSTVHPTPSSTSPLHYVQHQSPIPTSTTTTATTSSHTSQAHHNSNNDVLIDRFHRQHSYLRISLTEKCNLRCTYCMPAEGVPVMPKDASLTAGEIARLAQLFVEQGVDKIRLTGGEPTLRKDLLQIMSSLNTLKRTGKLKQIGLTTNGILLTRMLPQLVEAGLTHLNVSLDTLDPFKFELMTRRPAAGLAKVLQGIDLAISLGVQNVKVNVVVMRGVNDNEDVLRFVDWAKDKPITVRFIEYMPFDGNKWQSSKLVPFKELYDKIHRHYSGAVSKASDTANDTSKHWQVHGHAARIGFITSMTEHFCATCNRLRITADGNIKVCLFGNAEVSLRDAMRNGSGVDGNGPASDDELLSVIASAVGRKHARHGGMPNLQDLAKASNENRSMIRIGG